MPELRTRWLILLALLSVWPASLSAQIVVTDKQWGWDNKPRLNGFNLLNIKVLNSGNDPWKGSFRMQNDSMPLGVDIPILEPNMYIEPGGSRLLQFLVFVDSNCEFELSWGLGKDQREVLGATADAVAAVPEDQQGNDRDRQAVVQLRGYRTGSGASCPSFPEEYFPTSAAGIYGLQAILLDHVPEFQPAQEKAFLDWIYSGGELHLFSTSATDVLQFGGILSELNQPLDEFAIGSGWVVRHAMPLAKATRNFISEEVRHHTTGPKRESQHQDWNISGVLHRLQGSLKRITKPNHNWMAIYLLAFAYLLLLFPGCWLIGRKVSDYRITFGVILGVVVLFSLSFDLVGRRGYGEVTSVNFTAIARPASNGRSSVLQMSNVFVTAGGTYEISHPVEGAVYSTGQTSERVRGLALNRPVGMMRVDIPAFSDRSVLHAGIVPYSISSVSIVKAVRNSSGDLQELELHIDDLSRWPAEVLEMQVVHRDRIWNLASGTGQTLKATTPEDIERVISDFNWYLNPWSTGEDETADEWFRQTRIPALAYDLQVFENRDLQNFPFPDDRIRVYVFAEAPPEFMATGSLSAQQQGRVLFVQEVHLPAIETDLSPAKASEKTEPSGD